MLTILGTILTVTAGLFLVVLGVMTIIAAFKSE